MTETKKRLKNKYTSIIGAIILAGAGVLFVIGKYNEKFDLSILEFGALMAVGYIFLMAKDSLIEGIFLNIFKIKEK